MRVGFLSVFNYGSNIGGVENHIYFMAKELRNLGHEIIIFQPVSSDSPSIDSVKIEGVKIIKIEINPTRALSLIKSFNGANALGMFTAFLNKVKYFFSREKIACVVINEELDLLHQHDFTSNIFTTKIANKMGLRCILTNHTGEYLFLYKSLLGRLALRYLLNHYKFIIGPSKELTPEFVKNSTTIHNGVDHSTFFRMSLDSISAARKKYGIEEHHYIVLCPRRWAPTKGVIYLVRSIIENNYPKNYKFLFAGSDYDGFPKYKQEINALIDNSGKKNQFVRLGNIDVSEMNALYNVADIVVIPSLMEAVSLSAVEAMATGTPVVSTNVGGMPELITDGYNGLLIPPKSPSAIYAAIMELENEEIFRRIRTGSLSTAANYSWTSKAIETEEIYRKVLGPSSTLAGN